MSGNAVEDLDWYRRRVKEAAPPTGPVESPILQPPGGGDNYGGMDQVWAKLKEHDARFDRVEKKLDRIEDQSTHINTELSNAKFWFVGTTAAVIFAGLALVYSARQDTTATMSAALAAIQTVLAARPPETPPQPQVIVIPSYSASQTPAPIQAPQKPQE